MSYKVSIVDDDIQITHLLAILAKKNNLIAHTYNNVDLFLDNPHIENELILLDLCMPDIDGIEVIRKLAERKCTSKIVLMSGQDKSVLKSAQILANEKNLRCIDILPKPIHMSDLSALLKSFSKEKSITKEADSQPNFTKQDVLSALSQNDFILHYQPQVDIKKGCTTSVEALVRWQHPEKGLIFPDQFIQICEQEQLIGALTEQVIDMAIFESHKWSSNGINLNMSINVSAKNINSLSFPEHLFELINEKQMLSSLITLEITESQIMEELETSLDILTRLRLKGFKLSIDDFGTGYSSLSQLHKIPFTELKIDRSFIMNMTKDKDALAIVETCIMLSHKLGMLCVAEGVESRQHFDILADLGCDMAQGYYFARPMRSEQLYNWAMENQKMVSNG